MHAYTLRWKVSSETRLYLEVNHLTKPHQVMSGCIPDFTQSVTSFHLLIPPPPRRYSHKQRLVGAADRIARVHLVLDVGVFQRLHHKHAHRLKVEVRYRQLVHFLCKKAASCLRGPMKLDYM